MELLEQKKTAQPQEQDPKDDLLDHWRTQAATIEPKPRRRRRWLWRKDESLEDSANFPDPDIIAQKLIRDLPLTHPLGWKARLRLCLRYGPSVSSAPAVSVVVRT